MDNYYALQIADIGWWSYADRIAQAINLIREREENGEVILDSGNLLGQDAMVTYIWNMYTLMGNIEGDERRLEKANGR